MKKSNDAIFKHWLVVALMTIAGASAHAAPCQTIEDKAKLSMVKQAYERESLFLYDKKSNMKFDNLSKTLKKALLHDKACTRKGTIVCALDFEPIFNAQDWNTPKVQYSCQKGQVLAQFKNFDANERIGFAFVQEKGVWVFDDLHSKQVPSLKQMLLSQ